MGQGSAQMTRNSHHRTGNPYQQAPVLCNKISHKSQCAGCNACPLVLLDQVYIVFTGSCQQIACDTSNKC